MNQSQLHKLKSKSRIYWAALSGLIIKGKNNLQLPASNFSKPFIISQKEMPILYTQQFPKLIYLFHTGAFAPGLVLFNGHGGSLKHCFQTQNKRLSFIYGLILKTEVNCIWTTYCSLPQSDTFQMLWNYNSLSQQTLI